MKQYSKKFNKGNTFRKWQSFWSGHYHECNIFVWNWSNAMDIWSTQRILMACCLTHWGRVTHICISQIIIIGSESGLSPDRRQAIIRNNDGILLFGPLGRNFSEISVEIYSFSFENMPIWKCLENGGHLVSASISCLGLNVLTTRASVATAQVSSCSWV